MSEVSALRHAGVNRPTFPNKRQQRVMTRAERDEFQGAGLSGRDIQAISDIAGSTQPIPATT